MPPTTLEIVTRARDTIRDDPESYEFMDYCRCLAGHIYLAATGEKFDSKDVSPYRVVDSTTPFGRAISDTLAANGHSTDRLSPSALSHLNSRLALGIGDSNDDLRAAAVKALDTTIAHLEEAS